MRRTWILLFLLCLTVSSRRCISQTATESVLHSFCEKTSCPDGEFPNYFIQASDGSLYGSTSGGGTGASCDPFGCGTIYKLGLNGDFTILVDTIDLGFIEGENGNFYGAGDGYFTVTPSGKITFINAASLAGGLTPASNGGYYSVNGDSAFSVTLSGTTTSIYQFCKSGDPSTGEGCSDGSEPSDVVQGRD